MGYLDFPRIHFTGGFQTSPSTINNAPLNYKRATAADVEPWDMDSWWNAYGNGVFDFSNCAVSSAQSAFDTEDTTIVGQQVVAAYTSSPPKIADLDPMQQNVSELWGLTVQVGLSHQTGKLVGNFSPVAFSNIWAAADGAKYRAAAGAAIYQSTLTNVSVVPGNSKVLQKLQESLAGADDCLSIRLQVRAYNGTDTSYDLTSQNLAKLRQTSLKPLPDDVWNNLSTISKYQQGVQAGTANKDGLIIATLYLNYLLQRWLGQAAAQQWGDTIRAATRQSQPPVISTQFTYGKLIGTIGPTRPQEPRFFSAKRMFAPVNASTANFAAFQVEKGVLSIDLSNALQTQNPADGPLQSYGKLKVGYADGTALVNGDVPYTDFAAFLKTAGIIDLKVDAADAKKVLETPLALYSNLTNPATVPSAVIKENAAGLWMRADQFVFRMNPGVAVSDPHLSSDKATIDVFVSRFGTAPKDESVRVRMHLMTPQESLTYTNNTVGTGGTPGLDEVKMGVPDKALTFAQTVAVKNGRARFDLTATNPGNPRSFLDGQIYFLTYTFDPPVPGYVQGPDDVISLLVFENKVVSVTPTWANTIGEILSQYGRLYLIMSRFGLADHEQVKLNHEQIAAVLKRPLNDPFHMPVTRDLSESRRQLILKWMQSGMP
ncbi:MAG: hypothetical protein RL701_5967 [Pseudomonadota bacterium]|jgi:hypothetical protein